LATAKDKVLKVFKRVKNTDDFAPQNSTARLYMEVVKDEVNDQVTKAACDKVIKKIATLPAPGTIVHAAAGIRNSPKCPRCALARKDFYPKRSYGPVHTSHAVKAYTYKKGVRQHLEKRIKEQRAVIRARQG
jgi:hypothetical protein